MSQTVVSKPICVGIQEIISKTLLDSMIRIVVKYNPQDRHIRFSKMRFLPQPLEIIHKYLLSILTIRFPIITVGTNILHYIEETFEICSVLGEIFEEYVHDINKISKNTCNSLNEISKFINDMPTITSRSCPENLIQNNYDQSQIIKA
jgi:hypothetical protein